MSKFQPGDRVCCRYRIPTAHQWWIHDVHVGVIETPDDKDGGDGRWSEKRYCDETGSVKVRYPFGVMYERPDSLFPSPHKKSFPLTSREEAEAIYAAADAFGAV